MVLKKKSNKTALGGLPTAEELRLALKNATSTPARAALNALFDEGTFVETAAYTKRSFHDCATTAQDDEFEGVITGYGAVDGALVFAFAQDEARMKGAMDERHASKIVALYDLAMKKGAPVVGMFASSGAFVEEGVSALAAYGKLLRTVTDASGAITQIAYILGNCTGTSAAIAASFDFVVKSQDAAYYVVSPDLGGKAVANDAVSFQAKGEECVQHIRALLSYLPEEGDVVGEATDDINRRLGDMDASADLDATLSALCDNGEYLEFAPHTGKAAATAFATVAGIKCGIVANRFSENGGLITEEAAYKMAQFLRLCDCYSLPVVTLVDSLGLSNDITVDAVKALAIGYTQLEVPQVTVIMGHAVGAAFTLMGSKSLGAELVYTLDGAEIGVLSASTAVAFAWNGEISPSVTREELESKWKATVSTPVAAASQGEVEDIISTSEMRPRIASALLMLTC